jgi:hypothetical protein
VLETSERVRDLRGRQVQNDVTLETSGEGWMIRIEATPTGSRVLAYPKRFFNGQEQSTFS